MQWQQLAYLHPGIEAVACVTQAFLNDEVTMMYRNGIRSVINDIADY